MKFALQPILENVISSYSKPGQTVLDPMAGYGYYLIVARKLGRNVVGFDINPRYEKPELNITIADAKKMPLPDSSVDLITTGFFFWKSDGRQANVPGAVENSENFKEYLLGVNDIVSDCSRVLKPGGFFIHITGCDLPTTKKKDLHKVFTKFFTLVSVKKYTTSTTFFVLPNPHVAYVSVYKKV